MVINMSFLNVLTEIIFIRVEWQNVAVPQYALTSIQPTIYYNQKVSIILVYVTLFLSPTNYCKVYNKENYKF